MQDKYVGDIGDFCKYGLLREMCPSSSNAVLGIVWYWQPDDGEPGGDNKFKQYLRSSHAESKKYQKCESRLYTALNTIVFPNGDSSEHDCAVTHVADIEGANVLPAAAPKTYFRDEVAFGQQCPTRRLEWHISALDKTNACETVFLDPDNGIVPNDLRDLVASLSGSAGKHVLLHEVASYIGRKQNVIVVHHVPQGIFCEDAVSRELGRLRKMSPDRINPFAVCTRVGVKRCFFVVPSGDASRQTLCRRLSDSITRAWGNLLELHYANRKPAKESVLRPSETLCARSTVYLEDSVTDRQIQELSVTHASSISGLVFGQTANLTKVGFQSIRSLGSLKRVVITDGDAPEPLLETLSQMRRLELIVASKLRSTGRCLV